MQLSSNYKKKEAFWTVLTQINACWEAYASKLTICCLIHWTYIFAEVIIEWTHLCESRVKVSAVVFTDCYISNCFCWTWLVYSISMECTWQHTFMLYLVGIQSSCSFILSFFWNPRPPVVWWTFSPQQASRSEQASCLSVPPPQTHRDWCVVWLQVTYSCESGCWCTAQCSSLSPHSCSSVFLQFFLFPSFSCFISRRSCTALAPVSLIIKKVMNLKLLLKNGSNKNTFLTIFTVRKHEHH